MAMQVVIMSGLPGSGKSTYAAKLVKHAPYQTKAGMTCYKVCADDFHMVEGEYRFDPRKAGEAHKWCLQRFLDILTSEDNPDALVVVDNTNTTAHEISPYYRVAEAMGWDACIIRLHMEPMEAFKHTTHNVPIATIMSMYKNLLTDPLPPYWKATHLVAWSVPVFKSVVYKSED